MLLMRRKSSVDAATKYTNMTINTECIISRMSSYDLGLHRLLCFGWHFFSVGKTYSSQVPFVCLFLSSSSLLLHLLLPFFSSFLSMLRKSQHETQFNKHGLMT